MKILIVMILAISALAGCDGSSADSMPDGPQKLVILSDKDRHAFRIELALTPQDQQRGLMGRTEMPEDSGMLFYFPKEQEHSFWMKNTLIPLDMVFIRKDATIARVHDSAQPKDLTSVPSGEPVIAILELNGGTAKKLGIEAGDTVRHVFWGNAN